MQRVYDSLKPAAGGEKVLTDDKAPVEMLGIKAIDEIIGDELEWIREAIKQGDFSSILG